MKIGVDYYPEHWPRERWPVDAALMRDAGITVVRVAEFAWSRMEPEPGKLDFDWLDEAVLVLHDHGIDVVMGTPTATPPRWLAEDAEAGESIYQVDRDGRRRAFGTRRHYCHTSPRYLAETRRIVEAQAGRYGSNAAIVAWQIDNEFGCHDTTVCYCDTCRAAFARWLEERYGSIDEVNRAWGTVFWSQTYRSFDEVIVPAFTAVEQPGRHTHNPGLLLDYQRFSSDTVVAYQKLQIDLIRAQTRTPITHNFMGHFPDIDYYDLARDLDFVSWDNYPMNQWSAGSTPASSPGAGGGAPDAGTAQPAGTASERAVETARAIGMGQDITRGTKRKNFWVMEQLSGPCGWAVLGPTPAPGQIRLWSYQGVAHGADAIVYFRWRAARFGTEQYWYGVLDHDGTPRRRYAEVKAIGAEAKLLSERLDGTTTPADVLLVRSFDNLWSQRFQPHADGLSYEGQLQAYYNALAAWGTQVDVGSTESDFSNYRLVVAPLLNLTDARLEERLAAYVAGGGSLVLTFRSGTREWTNTMRDTPIPGPFAELAGITVEEFDALSGRRTVGVAGDGLAGEASIWADLIEPRGAEVLATYRDGWYAGRAAVTRRAAGTGSVTYVGCDLDAGALERFVAGAAEAAGAVSVREQVIEEAPAIVEAAVRSASGLSRPAVFSGPAVLFLLNHGDTPAVVRLRKDARNLLSPGGEARMREIALEPWGVAVLEVEL